MSFYAWAPECTGTSDPDDPDHNHDYCGRIVLEHDGGIIDSLSPANARELADQLHNAARRAQWPWTVSDTANVAPGGQVPILDRFATHDEAADYISTLPDHSSGRYGLDGPTP